jgi:tRNA pseudouridine55 synthase
VPAAGILVLNKPSGIASRRATDAVSRLLGEKKAGHVGTLDPLASGVLPVAVGAATRLIPFLEPSDKLYRATIRLGRATDTQDAAGETLFTAPYDLDPAAITAAAATFQGELRQLPPMYSALKKDGVPLYRLARSGVTVERVPRRIVVFALLCESIALPDLTLRVHCGPGVYIRTLAHDLGLKLGCGAHLAALVRLQSGPFTLDQAADLDDLDPESARARLLPPAACLPHLPALELTGEEEAAIRDGRAIPLRGLVPGGLARLLVRGELLAVARAETDGFIRPLRVFPGAQP